MEVARTSMIHAAAPHFLWPFAVRYAAHQLNLWPRVSLVETSPTLCWTGKVGDASVFRVWCSRAFVRDTSADKLSACAIPCVFLGFPPDAPGWQFYHPTSRRFLSSKGVTFDESVPFYRLFPYRSAPPPPPPLFLAPVPPPVDPLPSQGPAPSSVSQSDGAKSGGAEPRGAALSGGCAGASLRLSPRPEPLSPKQLREWLVWRACLRNGAARAGATGDSGDIGGTGAGGAGITTGAGDAGGAAAAGPGGARTRGTGAAGTGGVGGAGAGDPTLEALALVELELEALARRTGAGAGGAGAVHPGAGGAGAEGAGGTGVGDPVRPRPCFVLGVPSSTALTPGLLCPPLDRSQPPLQPAFPLPAPSPYSEQTAGLTECRERVFRPTSPVRTGRHVPRSRPPPVPGTHAMALLPDPESDRARAASPTVSRLLETDPSFESTAATALVAELVDLAAACRLDYATDLLAKSESASPPSIGVSSMLLAPDGDPNAPDIPTPCSYAEAITGPYSSQWQAAMDAEMASWKSIGTYVDAVPPSGANIVDGMWILIGSGHRVLRLPSRRVLLLEASVSDRGLRRPVYGLRQAPREWHDTLKTTLAAVGFTPSIADPLLFLRIDTSLPPFYILVYVDDLVFATADTEALPHVPRVPSQPSGSLRGFRTLGMGLVLGGRGPVVHTGHVDASWVDDSTTQRSSQGYTFSLGSGSVTWRSTRSSSVLSSSCKAEIYAGAMAAQELRWLTYLLTDLGEQPRSPLVLYVDNKAMIALCQEHRLEQRTKHIILRYFLARELQQHGQLRLTYAATRANTADIFTKALPPGDHQRFSTLLGLVPTLPHLLTA
ncbi:unnamed protein product [Closterium sp. NIES-53]